MADDICDADYQALASFRFELRRFLAFSELAAGDAGLTAQQYQALLAIRAAPGAAMLVGELADHLLLRPHSATGLVDRLEKIGVVRRQPGDTDRRRVTVGLTPHGEAILASLATMHRDALRRLGPLWGGIFAKL